MVIIYNIGFTQIAEDYCSLNRKKLIPFVKKFPKLGKTIIPRLTRLNAVVGVAGFYA